LAVGHHFSRALSHTSINALYAILGQAHRNEQNFVENFFGQILSLQKKALFLQKFKTTA